MTALREGFTTGSCAAAAALASCLWQWDGECPTRVSLTVPAGKTYTPKILPREHFACAVIKDSGDDPDVTNRSEVWARVVLDAGPGPIRFASGEGVGTITLPGMKLPVGEAAINPVPRQMMEAAVRSVYPDRGALVTVGIVGGRELAKQTFNPRLGVVNGLSVLGTTGVVRPMSEEALTESIRLELSVVRAQGHERLGLVFGSQGEKALKAYCPSLPCVQMSNFVGFALDAAAEIGFTSILMAGQPGKLVKVAGGIMQTHSKYGDGRKEPVMAHLGLMGAPATLLQAVYDSVTLDGVIPVIHAAGYDPVWDRLCQAAAGYAVARIHGDAAVSMWMMDGQGRRIGQYNAEEMNRNETHGH